MQIASFILENNQRVLAAIEQKVEKRRLGVKRVSEHQIKGARIGGNYARQQAQSGLHLIFPGLLRFMIQEQTNRWVSWRRTGQQQQGDLPVIKLNAIPFLTVDGSLQTART